MSTWLEPPPPPYRRGMGCFGKGCLILCCFIFFLLLAGAVGVYVGMKHYSALGHSFLWARKTHVLAEEPSPVPQFDTTDENISAAKQKWEDFENTRDQPAHIELTADDLNNLIAKNRHARGKAFVAIEGNRLRIQTSVPLGEFALRCARLEISRPPAARLSPRIPHHLRQRIDRNSRWQIDYRPPRRRLMLIMVA